MLFPCDDSCSGDKVWVFWHLERSENFVSFGVMECHHEKAEDEGLSMTAAEIFRPSGRTARIRQPVHGGGSYGEIYRAVFNLLDAEKKDLPPEKRVLREFYGDAFIKNRIDPEAGAPALFRLTSEELSRMPEMASAFDKLFAAIPKDAAGIERAWRRFPPMTQKLFEPA